MILYPLTCCITVLQKRKERSKLLCLASLAKILKLEVVLLEPEGCLRCVSLPFIAGHLTAEQCGEELCLHSILPPLLLRRGCAAGCCLGNDGKYSCLAYSCLRCLPRLPVVAMEIWQLSCWLEWQQEGVASQSGGPGQAVSSV